jgi:hypothetical protein
MQAVAVNTWKLAAHKDKGLSVVHRKALHYLRRCPKTPSGIVRFPEVFRTLSWLLHLNRGEARELLKELVALGVVELVPFHGVRIIAAEEVENGRRGVCSSYA